MNLVTGGTGFLGAHVIYELLRLNQPVRALKRPHASLQQLAYIFSCYHPQPQQLLDRIEWIEGDVLDIFSLEDALQGITHVYHCAAFVSFKDQDKEVMMHTNIAGTANLVNACLAHPSVLFCHVSSVAALGEAEQKEGQIDEHCEFVHHKKASTYAVSKFESEREVWRGMEEGLKAVIVNPSIIMGPGNWKQGSAALVSLVAKQLEYYPLGGSGIVDARDVASAMVFLNQDAYVGERFILSAYNLSYRSLLGMLAHELHVKPPRKPASSLVLEMLWRLSALSSRLGVKDWGLTRESARSAQKNSAYNNQKVLGHWEQGFRPLNQSIQDLCAYYKKTN